MLRRKTLLRILAACAVLLGVIGTLGTPRIETPRSFLFIGSLAILGLAWAWAEERRRRFTLQLIQGRLEEDLAKTRQLAEESRLAKSAFLKNMSHEIRTPLGAILGFSELLRSDEESDRQESLEVIHRNSHLLSKVISDIIDLTKVEAGHLEIEKLIFDPRSVFDETLASLQLMAAEKGIGLHAEGLEALPLTMESDPLRIKQILMGIVGNAIKFTERGEVRLQIAAAAEAPGEQKLVILVSDTGRGLRAEEASHLFDVFSQGDESTTRRYGGTGVGLALSRRLARALGGDVMLAESTFGRGSVFKITLDAGAAVMRLEAAGLEPSRGPVRSAGTAADETSDIAGLKVLIVEDARDNQLLLGRILSREGAVFEIAENGELGVEKALKGSFDIVLMDVQMPVMDGFQAMLRLRKLGYGKPIVALTAHAMREERDRCLTEGFTDHMSKPIDRRKLKELLHRIGKSQSVPPIREFDNFGAECPAQEP